MKFSEALEAIKKLENGADLASAIEGELDGLKSKNYEIIGEKRNATTKLSAIEAALMAVASAVGITGDIDAVLGAIEPKITELKTAQTKLTEAETRATAAETKVSSFERKGKLANIATKAGASAAVLETLFGEKLDQFAIEGETVKFGDKSLREYVEADAVLKDFIPSLFPASAQVDPKPEAAKPQAKLPSGSPKGDAPDADPIANHLKRHSGWKVIAK